MIRVNAVLPAALAVLLMGCSAQDAQPKNEAQPKGKDALDYLIVVLDRINEWSDRADDTFAAPPRVVPRGAKPEIIADEAGLSYAGKLLEFGTPLSEWKRVIGVPPSRINDVWAVWDKLGLRVRIQYSEKQMAETIERQERGLGRIEYDRDTLLVTKFDVRLIKDPTPDGNDMGEHNPLLSPRGVFPGYVEIGGVGVDGKSVFWDLNRLGRKTPYRIYYRCSHLKPRKPTPEFRGYHMCEIATRGEKRAGDGGITLYLADYLYNGWDKEGDQPIAQIVF